MPKTSAFKHRLTGATDEQLSVAVKLAEEMAEKLKFKYGAADEGVAPSAMLMVALRLYGKKLGYAGLLEFLRVLRAEVETGDLTELMTPEEREEYEAAGGRDQLDPLLEYGLLPENPAAADEGGSGQKPGPQGQPDAPARPGKRGQPSARGRLAQAGRAG